MPEILTVNPETVGLSSARLQRLDRWAERLVDAGKLPGVLTMVMRRGQLTHLSVCGKADVERGVPLRYRNLHAWRPTIVRATEGASKLSMILSTAGTQRSVQSPQEVAVLFPPRSIICDFVI